MRFDVHIEVRLRDGVADPEGATVERSLPGLGFSGINNVRMGKNIRFTIETSDAETARAQVTDMCDRFLTNPAIEEADINIGEVLSS